MITPEVNAQNIDGKLARPLTFYGLSTDEKPVENVANGSKFIEMDTSSRYLFNLEDEEWDEWSSGGGGGGGGSSTLAGLTDVDISNPADGQTLVYNATSGKWENGASSGVMMVYPGEGAALDKTWAEITSAIESGNVVQMVERASGEGQVEADVLLCSHYNVSDLGDEIYYHVTFYNLFTQTTYAFVATSSDGYPVYSEP